MDYFRHTERWLCLSDTDSDIGHSAAWVLPVPLEITAAGLSNARLGPAALIVASHTIEREAAPTYGIHTLPTLHPDLASPQAAIESITEGVVSLEIADQVLVTLGGEHSLTVGVVAALATRHPNLVVVQLDAHADLLDMHLGTPYSYRCAMRRCLEYAQVVQCGVREMTIAERDFAQGSDRVHSLTVETIRQSAASDNWTALQRLIAGKPVYLSIDLSVFDSTLITETACAVPGGLDWATVNALIAAIVRSGTVIGLDCVELSPQVGSQAGARLGARLIQTTLDLVMDGRGVA